MYRLLTDVEHVTYNLGNNLDVYNVYGILSLQKIHIIHSLYEY